MNEPNINVAIVSDTKIRIILDGLFFGDDFGKIFSGKVEAEYYFGKIQLIHDSKKYYTNCITFHPEDFSNESFLVKGVTIGKSFHWEKKEDERFRGSLKLIVENEKITVVNTIPVESYLLSVIASEMSATSSEHFLKAHAIISRSWLFAQIQKRENSLNENPFEFTLSKDEIVKWYDREDHKLYDFCADDHCQRYQGITKAYTNRVARAILETRGLVLTHNNRICDTRFSKSCGGKTESFENVWQPIGYPYLTSIVDYKYEPDNYQLDLTNEKNAINWIKNSPNTFCNCSDPKILSQVLLEYDQSTTDFFRWEVKYTQKKIAELISGKLGTDMGNIIDLIPVERGNSGRIIKLKIVGSKNTITIGKELEIRRTLSVSHLYSSAFYVEKNNIIDNIPEEFIIKGAGWGHGVGFCQIGGAVMAVMGYKFDEILLHYFRGTQITRLYE